MRHAAERAADAFAADAVADPEQRAADARGQHVAGHAARAVGGIDLLPIAVAAQVAVELRARHAAAHAQRGGELRAALRAERQGERVERIGRIDGGLRHLDAAGHSAARHGAEPPRARRERSLSLERRASESDAASGNGLIIGRQQRRVIALLRHGGQLGRSGEGGGADGGA